MSYPPRVRRSLTGCLVLLSACSGDTPSQTYSSAELEQVKAELRDGERLRSFETGVTLAREWAERAPDEPEIRALYARQLAGWHNWNEAHAEADAILADEPDDPWGLYARAMAILSQLDDQDDAAEPSLRAWQSLPRPEFAGAHAAALRFTGAEPSFTFLNSLDSLTRRAPEVLYQRAQVENQARYQLGDPTYADSALATLAELRERWPTHVDGYVLAAEYLFRANRGGEALPLIEEAVRLSPGAVDVRQWHWWILWESDVLPADERRAAVDASIAAFQAAAPENVRGLSATASMFRDMEDLERATELEEMVFALAPESRHATQIRGREYQDAGSKLNQLYQEKGSDSPEYREQLVVVRDAVNRFLERPLYDNRYRSSAYVRLYFALAAMDPVPPEELAEAVRGLAEYERLNPHITYAAGPISMADHTPYAEEAAEIAKGGMEAALAHAERMRSADKTDGEFEEIQHYYQSLIHEATGWAYFKAGRVEEGRELIEQAVELEGRNQGARYHLGQVFEHDATVAEERGDEEAARESLDKAEDSYITGLLNSRPGTNPNQAAIEALYERLQGSRDGIEEYLATLEERNQVRRKERIMESRLEAAGTYEAFELARLDEGRIDSGELEGKIAVIHFWGTWCGPCIVEMPEYQKFDARYRDDPDVVVVSISNDNSIDVVEEYMTRSDFDFSVLMDDGYVQRAGISAWPTTWFVDPDGQIQFVKEGNTSKLDEEFSWRVEAIRSER